MKQMPILLEMKGASMEFGARRMLQAAVSLHLARRRLPDGVR